MSAGKEDSAISNTPRTTQTPVQRSSERCRDFSVVPVGIELVRHIYGRPSVGSRSSRTETALRHPYLAIIQWRSIITTLCGFGIVVGDIHTALLQIRKSRHSVRRVPIPVLGLHSLSGCAFRCSLDIANSDNGSSIRFKHCCYQWWGYPSITSRALRDVALFLPRSTTPGQSRVSLTTPR